ncbi:MAG TPA: chorismate mutase [Stackebrandtia sp.]|nr:chorismate mutase [Stackebrandtia sp.]HZE40107.1 chorismate mutase [Stackebrandtia sp.]
MRALRGAVQLEHDDRDHLVDSVQELFQRMLSANGLDSEDLISVILTATPDLVSEFPAKALRQLGLDDVPLMCAQELDVDGAMPRVVRILAHAETPLPRSELQHVYLGGAAKLRADIAVSSRR